MLQPPAEHTFTLRHGGGAIEVGGGVARTGNAVVLAEVRLVGAHGAADAAMDARVVVVARGALNCGSGEKEVASGVGSAALRAQPVSTFDKQTLTDRAAGSQFPLLSSPSLGEASHTAGNTATETLGDSFKAMKQISGKAGQAPPAPVLFLSSQLVTLEGARGRAIPLMPRSPRLALCCRADCSVTFL